MLRNSRLQVQQTLIPFLFFVGMVLVQCSPPPPQAADQVSEPSRSASAQATPTAEVTTQQIEDAATVTAVPPTASPTDTAVDSGQDVAVDSLDAESPEPTVTPVPTLPPTPTASPTPTWEVANEYTYVIDRSALPYAVPYPEVHVRITAGPDPISIQDEFGPLSFDREEDEIIVTTRGEQLFLATSDAAATGEAVLRPLPGGKIIAWSHGIDDNAQAQTIVDLFNQNDGGLTFYLMTGSQTVSPCRACWYDIVDESQDRGHTIDPNDIIRELPNGHSVGIHGKACGDDVPPSDFQAAYDDIMAYGSHFGDFFVTSGAAPCNNKDRGFDMLSIRSNSTLIFVEGNGGSGQEQMILNGQPITGTYTFADENGDDRNKNILVSAIDLDQPIKRVGIFEANRAELIARFDWLVDQADEDHQLWFDSFNHGNENLLPFANYVFDTYGDITWVAPSDRVIASWLHAQYATVSQSQSP